MKHIIIADDDPDIQDMMCIVLKRFSYQPDPRKPFPIDRLLQLLGLLMP